MTQPEPPFGVDPSRLAAYKTVHQKIITGDYDVFGDGSVRILRAYGHTPGHQVLLVHLARSGNVILAGDLYHTRDNREHRRVPDVNTDRADTLASMDRVEHLAERLHARVIIQHSPEDFRSLPKFPAYLE
jgi:glyoxylase-like metal-dependent hydrolase (beta-lactamase superfamily II)